jgi:hypothetical protein
MDIVHSPFLVRKERIKEYLDEMGRRASNVLESCNFVCHLQGVYIAIDVPQNGVLSDKRLGFDKT